ncbi:MAG: PCRF domain-containing protein, partial [Acetanaerobacterium sp.]
MELTMLIYEELKQRLTGSKAELDDLKDALSLDKQKSEIAYLEEQTMAPGFWDDPSQSQKVLQQIAQCQSKVRGYEKIETDYEDTLTLIELADEDEDESLYDEALAGAEGFERKLSSARLATLLIGEYDALNAIITFHAGAGGTEAQDWAQMLYR